MWEPAISGMGNAHNCAPKLQAYPPIFSLTPKASGSTRLQSCEDKVFNSHIINLSNEKSPRSLPLRGLSVLALARLLFLLIGIIAYKKWKAICL